jgi:exodeoxyribonuclease V beta subunit
LRDIPVTDQLRELDFELPLVGGDTPGGADVRLTHLADLVRRLPADDPVRPYADRLASLGSARLRGYLAGSIDVVLRVDGRYVVVDHKTNRLAPRDEPLTAWHYRREALDSAMLAADYPLQALLYLVALHRYLRWRVVGYDPAEHLGGVLYLFLRGMCGVDAGVWSWQPPASLVVSLSDLLAGVSP